jgi:dipeptidyl aminopeptidase/acylaminoacyl peptidase
MTWISVPATVTAVAVEDFLDFPHPTELTAASEAPVFAWVVKEDGIRNVWVARGPAFEARRITDYTVKDGQEIIQLRLTSDGSHAVYVRGGDPHGGGGAANPTSDPQGVEQGLWAVSTGGGEPWKLGSGASPIVAPNGETVLFTSAGQWYKVPLAKPEGEAARPTPLFKVRGGARSLVFSPDGGKIAFVSSRGRHSFVGVFDTVAQTVSWMAPDFNRDSNPAWSPDGTRIAFVRSPGVPYRPGFEMRLGSPFEIWVADAATGKGRAVWTSPHPLAGGGAQSLALPLAWPQDDLIVFQSEHEGWLHPYTISAAGENERDLFDEPCELAHAALAPNNRAIYYSANCNAGDALDIDRKHIWRVDLGSGKKTPITSGAGIELMPAASAGGHVAWLGSEYDSPMSAVIDPAGRAAPKRVGPSPPPGFPQDRFVMPEQVTFSSPGDDKIETYTIHCQVFEPKDLKPGDNRPVVAFFHGGASRQMLLGWHEFGYYSNAYAMNQFFADQGYIAISVNYRLGIGYGRDFRQVTAGGARGAAEHTDLVYMAKYLRERGDVDPARIGLWGGSYGGVMTAMGLARNSDLFAAGVDIHGVHDWRDRYLHELPQMGMIREDFPEETWETAFRSSAMASIDDWTSPVLVIHGDDDRNVDIAESIHLVHHLRRRGVHVETLVFPDEVHDFMLQETWDEIARATVDFFDRMLRRSQ